MSRFEYTPNQYSGISADMKNFPPKETFVANLQENKQDVRFLKDFFNLTPEVEEKLKDLCHSQYSTDLDSRKTLFSKRANVLGSRLCSYTLSRGGLTKAISGCIKDNSLSQKLKDMLSEQYALLFYKVFVISKGLEDHWEIDEVQDAIERAPVILEEVLSRSTNNYWVRSRIDVEGADSNAGVKPSLNYPRERSNFVDITVTQDYHKVVSENLEVVNSGGKMGFPLALEVEPLPKDADLSYRLFKAEVLTLLPRKIHDVVYSDADKFAHITTKYICVAHTTDGKIVSCSTTPGRAVGGCNTKTKNKVLNTLEFSF
jgi:hypothetical protein